ncbi:hypothetical protein MP228_003113 [Amoeboaphelidium protococcarum]|nr:hypothetical protein MP228_003113 [Amoeboaphelidium protococcarum]
MACSKYEYVKKFELSDAMLPNTYIMVRIDGRGFSRFTKEHKFEKPYDLRGIQLMNSCAERVMKDFSDITLAYGQSDEYSFLISRSSNLYHRRSSKLVSTIVSLFTATYVFEWSKYFPGVELQYPPSFDGRAVSYPSVDNIRDYFSWRQVDCHINNLYNTCFWKLVSVGGLSEQAAEEQLRPTNSAMKNELLFTQFQLNYNSLPEMYKKGSLQSAIVNQSLTTNFSMQNFFKPRSGVEQKQKQKPVQDAMATGDGPVYDHNQPWVEKYRPRNIDEVSSQEEVVSVLKSTIESKNLPHLLFYGAAGTGKTSTILALCRQVFGHDFKSRVLELNASDERGINVIRKKVKDFARTTLHSSDHNTVKDSMPPYKIVILDEADSMTSDAQNALRRTMETYSKQTRFCLICNYVSRIIEPLASRCAKFRFKPLDSVSATNRLKYIAAKENVQVEDSVYSWLITMSEGDLRRAITFMQSASRLVLNQQDQHAVLKVSHFVDIVGACPQQLIQDFMQACKHQDYAQICHVVEVLIRDGFSANQFLVQLHDHIIQDASLSTRPKSLIMQKLAIVESRLINGGDETMQLMDLALQTSSYLQQQQ